VRTPCWVITLAIWICLGVSGCTSTAQIFAEKIRARADEECHQGNQAACNTIVQALSDTKVGIESTSSLYTLTPDCDAGKQDACQQVAVMHLEFTAWCAAGNERACSAVKGGPWPAAKMDEPALVDAAKLSCLSEHFQPDSSICVAVQNF
jgi:hypothetical protein